MEGKWRDLPTDILDIVVNRLNTSDDLMITRRIRAVCSSWRSSVPYPITHLAPIEIPFPVNYARGKRPIPSFVLTRRKLLALSPIQGANKNNNAGSASTTPITPWVIQVEETEPNKWSLLDPIHGCDKVYFPKSELPDHINILDYKVTEISHSYYLCSGIRLIPSELLSFGFATLRVVVIVHQGSGSIKCGDYTVFVLSTAVFANLPSTNVAFWEAEQNCWTSVLMNGYSPLDIVNYKGELYGIDDRNRLLRFDASTCNLVEVALRPPSWVPYSGICYLAEFKDHLYLVKYYVFEDGVTIIDLKVNVLNEEAGAWDCATDLGGGVFYVGYDNVLSVSAKEVGLPTENVVFIEGFSEYISKAGLEGECSVMCKLEFCLNYVTRWWPDRAPFWPPPNWLKEIESIKEGTDD